jgi:hypothetical protein
VVSAVAASRAVSSATRSGVFSSSRARYGRLVAELLLGPLQQALADEDRPERREQLQLAERGALRLLKQVNTLPVAGALTAALAHDEQRRRAEALAELDRAKTAFT